jgi:predicted nucleic acid-binding protein
VLTHLLDTSAWLAHIFNEPGAAIVTDLFLNPTVAVGISAVALLEAHARIKGVRAGYRYTELVAAYKEILADIVPADERVVNQAIELRAVSSGRIPAMDALIAATAAHHNAILVHRDPHFQRIPNDALQQLDLTTTA